MVGHRNCTEYNADFEYFECDAIKVPKLTPTLANEIPTYCPNCRVSFTPKRGVCRGLTHDHLPNILYCKKKCRDAHTLKLREKRIH